MKKLAFAVALTLAAFVACCATLSPEGKELRDRADQDRKTERDLQDLRDSMNPALP